MPTRPRVGLHVKHQDEQMVRTPWSLLDSVNLKKAGYLTSDPVKPIYYEGAVVRAKGPK